jgi:O-antigen ligase
VQHDTIVAIATDTGAVGAILYIWFLATLFRSLLQLRRSARSPEKRDFYATCIAALAIFVINGTFADSRYFMSLNALVFFIVGLGLGIRADEPMRSPAVCEAGLGGRRRYAATEVTR